MTFIRVHTGLDPFGVQMAGIAYVAVARIGAVFRREGSPFVSCKAIILVDGTEVPVSETVEEIMRAIANAVPQV